MRLGILGGTFDPIHLGHLILAQEAFERFKLNRVIFVPAYIPPHKKRKHITTAADRLKMVALAIKGDKRFGISTFEINAKGRSYTVDTLRYFKKGPGCRDKLYFITGSDSLGALSKWKDIEEIFRLSHFVTAARPGYDIKKDTYGSRVIAMPMPAIGISSSLIRDKTSKGDSIHYIVPRRVADYIRKRKLYLK